MKWLAFIYEHGQAGKTPNFRELDSLHVQSMTNSVKDVCFFGHLRSQRLSLRWRPCLWRLRFPLQRTHHWPLAINHGFKRHISCQGQVRFVHALDSRTHTSELSFFIIPFKFTIISKLCAPCCCVMTKHNFAHLHIRHFFPYRNTSPTSLET